MHRHILGVAVLLMLAGCTGTFEVEQTEPIRVQIDGESEDTHVESGEDKEFLVLVRDRETVQFDVEVRSEEPSRIVIEVRDEDTGDVLGTEEVTVGGSGQDVVVQNMVVNVRGKDNVVVLAQAVEGEADVTVTAREGEQPSGSTSGDASEDTSGDDASDDGTPGMPPIGGNTTDNVTDNATDDQPDNTTENTTVVTG